MTTRYPESEEEQETSLETIVAQYRRQSRQLVYSALDYLNKGDIYLEWWVDLDNLERDLTQDEWKHLLERLCSELDRQNAQIQPNTPSPLPQVVVTVGQWWESEGEYVEVTIPTRRQGNPYLTYLDPPIGRWRIRRQLDRRQLEQAESENCRLF